MLTATVYFIFIYYKAAPRAGHDLFNGYFLFYLFSTTSPTDDQQPGLAPGA